MLRVHNATNEDKSEALNHTSKPRLGWTKSTLLLFYVSFPGPADCTCTSLQRISGLEVGKPLSLRIDHQWLQAHHRWLQQDHYATKCGWQDNFQQQLVGGRTPKSVCRIPVPLKVLWFSWNSSRDNNRASQGGKPAWMGSIAIAASIESSKSLRALHPWNCMMAAS